MPFWMDQSEIGNRGTLGITTLLTEVFLLQYTSDSMPRVSYVKAADLFLIVSFAFSFMALLESVIVYIYKRRILKAENGEVRNQTLDGRSSVSAPSVSKRGEYNTHLIIIS